MVPSPGSPRPPAHWLWHLWLLRAVLRVLLLGLILWLLLLMGLVLLLLVLLLALLLRLVLRLLLMLLTVPYSTPGPARHRVVCVPVARLTVNLRHWAPIQARVPCLTAAPHT